MPRVKPDGNPAIETKTADLQVASFLLARGCSLLRVDEGMGGWGEFVFSDVPEGALMAFYSDDDQVSAKRLFASYLRLRDLVVRRDGRAVR